jgi:uncharacterized protein YjbJ (UPF0337 family)
MDKLEGDAKIAAGKIKAEVGAVVRSPGLETKGKSEMSEGRLQKKVGEVKTFLGK